MHTSRPQSQRSTFPLAVTLALAACGSLMLSACGESPTEQPEVASPQPAPSSPPAGTRTDRTWTTLTDAELTGAHRAQLARATSARDAMFGQLTRALMQAMAQHGPAGAIDACRIEAPAIAARTAQDQSLRIGRTSWKLRNADNQTPQWATAFLEERAAEPRHAFADDGTFAAFLPIRMMSLCLTCHGEPAMIPADVGSALAQHYPNDQATGFGNGDLRGWFWVEVPGEALAP